jgi:hypothetical protein
MQNVLIGILGTLVALFVLRGLFFLAWRRRWHRFGHRRGRGWMLGRLVARLEATPEQERLLVAEVEAIRSAVAGLREGFSTSRSGLADALAGDAVDASALESLFEGEMARAAEVKRAAAAAFARVHAALDARQRRILSELVRCGPRHAHGRA